MIEIVCPSCQARYQLPDGSIGPEGRKVSCSSCSHKWRAQVEGAAAAHEQATPVSPVSEVAAVPDVAPDTPPYTPPDAPPDEVGVGHAAVAGSDPAPASGDREEQMAAIRQMLADLKEGVDAAPEVEAEAPPEPVTPEPTMRRRAGDDDEEIDALKSRIDDIDKLGKAAKGEVKTSNYNPTKLRRLHEKRAKNLQRVRERKKRSGGFLTGVTLVGTVTATMVGLYVMQPQIIVASPQMAPAMNEYVVTVDRYRVEINAKTTEWKTWLVERVGALGKDEE
jgi:predicted Zn finger-like uncharacterized protein